ncbi:hypothetical protein HC766_04685 [Candidatus Gracilibacteria bacterium]|nr:hypothetical protein [Candidatus Gracilibacteria bacterium]
MRILQERKEALNIKSLSFINSQEIQEGLKGGDLDINFVKIQWEELRIIKNANIDDYESCFDTESKNGNVTTYEFTFRKRHFLIPFPLEIYTVSCNY